MKTFIAASLAAIAFAGDISDDVQRELERDLEKFEDWERQAEREAAYEAEKEAANWYRELACWWAGVEPVTDQWSCPEWADVQRDVCSNHGRIWIEEWYSCMEPDSIDYQYYECENINGGVAPDGRSCSDYYYSWVMKPKTLKQKAQNLHKMLKKRTMTRYEVTLDEAQLSAIQQPVEDAQRDGDALFGETAAALEALGEEFAPRWEEQNRRQSQADAQAAEDFMNYLVSNVSLDGVPLSEIVGTPDQWILKKKAMKKGKVMQEGGVMTVAWEMPSPDEIADWWSSTAEPALERIEDLGEQIDDIANDVRRQAKNDFED